MAAYATLVERLSPHLVGHKVTVGYIFDKQIAGGCTDHAETIITVNLARHHIGDWNGNVELMLHELAHYTVRSNDHLIHKFYTTVGRLGAKLTRLALDHPELFGCRSAGQYEPC
jgi:hypothetical protein